MLIYGPPLGVYLLSRISLSLPLLLIGGSATLLGLCWLFYLCLRGDWITFWLRWYLKILDHSLGAFSFGLILPPLSFHWTQTIFGCSGVRLPVYVRRGILVAQISWLVLLLVSWSSSLAMWNGNFVFDLSYLWGFFFLFSPRLEWYVGCLWCYWFLDWFNLCRWDLGVCL